MGNRMNSIRNMNTVRWRHLHELYSGIIGNSLWVISLAIPVSYALRLGIEFENYSLSLIGALIIVLSFIMVRIKTPPLISRYPTALEYAKDTTIIFDKKELDLILEFKILELRKTQVTEGLTQEYSFFSEFETINKYVEELGDAKAVRNMALIKYDLINKESGLFRNALFISLLLGIIFLYMPLISSILKILKEMLIK